MITHVSIRNYKSLANVDVDLGPLTVLVGQNGTGKSNFVDALRFVSDSIRLNLVESIKKRNGFNLILHSSGQERSSNIEISLDYNFDRDQSSYAFELAEANSGNFIVRKESFTSPSQSSKFDRESGELRTDKLDPKSGQIISKGNPEKLGPETDWSQSLILLVLLAMPTWYVDINPLMITGFLQTAGYYTIVPDRLRKLGTLQTSRERLSHDGSNLSSVLYLLQSDSKDRFSSLKSYIARAVPDIKDISVKEIGRHLVVELTHQANNHDVVFDIEQESDGTLWLLGNLTALHQDTAPSLITIEEPELMVHPGVLGVLSDAIKEASLRSQVIITTHSPDLISLFDPSVIRVVEKVDGATRIAPLEDQQIEAVRQNLFSTGELMLLEGLRGQPQP